MAPNEPELRAALGAVDDPDLKRGIEELGILKSVSLRRSTVTVEVALPIPEWPAWRDLETAIIGAVAAVDGVREVKVERSVMSDEDRAGLLVQLALPRAGEPAALSGGNGGHGHAHGAPAGGPPRPLGHEQGRPNRFMIPGSRTRVIGISSGKGGVGKSSVAVNTAVALAAKGYDVGLLDADVYGFSVPKMLGVNRFPVQIDDLLVPPVVHGVRCLSMGFFVPDAQPVVWRGPMLHKALEQFLVDAYWGEPDFLLIDMPPGTGDVALSLGQYLPRTEILVVTTPQAAAQRVAQRSAFAARSLKLPVRGVVENLSWFTGNDGERYELFGAGGGKALAADLEVPLLGQIPLVPEVRVGGDEGRPVRLTDPDGEASKAFDALAERISTMGPVRVYRSELTIR